MPLMPSEIELRNPPHFLFENAEEMEAKLANPEEVSQLGLYLIAQAIYLRKFFPDLSDTENTPGAPVIRPTDKYAPRLIKSEIAERAANGLRKDIQELPFGRKLKDALNDPDFSDHNHEHSRRTERWLERIILNSECLQEKIDVPDWQDALLLFPYFHDADQLINQYRNKFERKRPIKVKEGHELAGGIMLMAMYKRYAKTRGISVDRAKKICRMGAILIFNHGYPESQNIDTFRFNMARSPSQIIGELKELRPEYPQNEGQELCLDPDFQTDFREELAELANDTNPLFEEGKEDADFLYLLYKTAVIADMMDMVAPPYESITRTLKTQRSAECCFSPHSQENIDALKAELETLNPALFPQPTDPKAPPISPEDVLVEAIFHGPATIGNTAESDLRRKLWEAIHIGEILEDTDLAKDKYIRSLVADIGVSSVYALQDLGRGLMKHEFGNLEKIYKRRIGFLQQKVDQRIERIICGEISQTADDVVKLLEHSGKKCESLMLEFDQLKQILSYKISTASASQDLDMFEKVTCRILETLKSQYGLSDEDMERIRNETSLDKGYPPWISVSTYDTLSPLDIIRTLFPQSGVIYEHP
jgi:hypothetical protein